MLKSPWGDRCRGRRAGGGGRGGGSGDSAGCRVPRGSGMKDARAGVGPDEEKRHVLLALCG